MGRLFVNLGHPQGILLRVETVEAAGGGIELIPQDDMKMTQGGGRHPPIMGLPARLQRV